MRALAAIGLALGCVAAPPRAPIAPTVVPPPVAHVEARAPIDPIVALAQTPTQISYVVPGAAQLELGGPMIHAADGAHPLAVELYEDAGSQLRVGVRLEHARFAIWCERARLLGIVARDVVVDVGVGPRAVDLSAPAIEVVLHGHAVVRVLGHHEHRTRVRYLGALEVDGWVGDDALVLHEAPHPPAHGRIPSGMHNHLVVPGAVIRAATEWTAPPLAIVVDGHVVDEVRALAGGWFEVSYEDGDLRVHGYLSDRLPPERVHKPHAVDPAPAPLVPNATVPAGACLYANERGEPIGFFDGAEPAVVERTSHGDWWTVAIETPWGPIELFARGASAAELAPCPAR